MLVMYGYCSLCVLFAYCLSCGLRVGVDCDWVCMFVVQAEDGIRDLVRSRGLGDVYKRQLSPRGTAAGPHRVTRRVEHRGVALPGERAVQVLRLSLINI